MQEFVDKYQFKNFIAKTVSEFGIDRDMFDRIFASVFLEIFEKEKLYPCIFNQYKISLVKRIVYEVKKIKKAEKENFLILFEDYKKLNNELIEIVIKIKNECKSVAGKCPDNENCKIDISQYPLFYICTQHKDLKIFEPDQNTTPEFIELIEGCMNKHGLFFLYNTNKELLYIGKGTNLGAAIIDTIWNKDIDGFAAIALTKTKSDIYIYEPYCIINEKPLLNIETMDIDELTINLEPLEKSEIVRIYDNILKA
jgi:hypothetical protein